MISPLHCWHASPDSKSNKRRGPKGTPQELINAIIELKRRNPRFGCLGIAHTITITFGIEINKDVVRRVIVRHYKPISGNTQGSSWSWASGAEVSSGLVSTEGMLEVSEIKSIPYAPMSHPFIERIISTIRRE